MTGKNLLLLFPLAFIGVVWFLSLSHFSAPPPARPSVSKDSLCEDLVLAESERCDTLVRARLQSAVESQEAMHAHIAALKKKATAAGIDYQLLPTDRPLDAAIREYFLIRKGRL